MDRLPTYTLDASVVQFLKGTPYVADFGHIAKQFAPDAVRPFIAANHGNHEYCAHD